MLPRGGVIVRDQLLVNCWVFCFIASSAPVLSHARDVTPVIPWFSSCEGHETSLVGAQWCARELSEACLLWRLARLVWWSRDAQKGGQKPQASRALQGSLRPASWGTPRASLSAERLPAPACAHNLISLAHAGRTIDCLRCARQHKIWRSDLYTAGGQGAAHMLPEHEHASARQTSGSTNVLLYSQDNLEGRASDYSPSPVQVP